jgi:hypothetical protein
MSVPDARKPSTYQLSYVTLHEAYQFLVQKYTLETKTTEEEDIKPPTIVENSGKNESERNADLITDHL